MMMLLTRLLPLGLLVASAGAKSFGLSSINKVVSIRGGSSDDSGSHSSTSLSSVDWRYFLAGGICAACSHGLTTPLDVIKTRMQTFPAKYSKGVLAAARDIVKTEGVAFLLTGLGPTVLGYGIEGALKFGFYEAFKVLFAGLTPKKVVNFLLASVLAGAIASIVLCPMEDARIKMVGDPAYAKDNLLAAFTRLFREHGVLATFRGLPAMLTKQVPYTMAKQVSFDLFAALLYSLAQKLKLRVEDLKWAISVGSAFLASLLSCIFSQPGDMVLTATANDKQGRTFPAIVADIYRAHGFAGFFLGVQARLAHVASIITSQLVIYDIVKLALGLPATGSH
jgi:solute carrier family 25 phosphate transporter 3